jgi:hypothetical protein
VLSSPEAEHRLSELEKQVLDLTGKVDTFIRLQDELLDILRAGKFGVAVIKWAVTVGSAAAGIWFMFKSGPPRL